MRKKTDKAAAARSARLEVLLRTAALTIDRSGSLPILARTAGYTNAALNSAIRRGHFTQGMAAAIECAVGRDVLPKEKLLNPN